MNNENSPELPDLFQCENGQRVATIDDWSKRRNELSDLILDIEYGALPPTPEFTQGELLHEHNVPLFLNACHQQYKLTTGPNHPYSFTIDLYVPHGDGPFPVILNGDGCWCYLSDEVILEVLSRGYILAQFNRVEIALDNYTSEKTSGIYEVFPGYAFGSISAWAWGYHRCIDFLITLDNIFADQIAITGHSRGGKAALLAGATDERIALTNPNNSGCGGAGAFRSKGPECEVLSFLVNVRPEWFCPGFENFGDREDLLPFDQHSLQALVAPRALLCTEALGDLWANPTGTWQAHSAAQEAFRFLGVPDKNAIHFRKGEHAHSSEDWKTLLQFADWKFKGIKPQLTLNKNPFPGLPSAHSWAAPL